MPDPKVELALEYLRSGRCKTAAEAARNAKAKPRTVSENWAKEQDTQAEESEGRLTTTSKVGDLPSKWTPEALAEYYGVDLEKWVEARIRGNLWGDPGDPRNQLRVDWISRAALVEPVDPGDWTPPPKPRERKKRAGEPRKIVICGDHHCPHEDRELHALFLQFLEDEKPDEGIILGDLLDFHTVSRHRDREGFSDSVNDCLRAAFKVLRDYRDASPDTQWTMLRGNHDDRIYHGVIDNFRGLHKITPGGGLAVDGAEDERASLSFRRLLYLDELGIDLVDEEWERGKAKITRRFTARHGYTSSKNSTEQMLSKLAHSTVQGHTHRLSFRYRTEHDDTDPDEPTQTRLGAEAGCMCEISEGLGYTTQPDWQQGALLVHAWPDEDFHVDSLIYVPGRLLSPNGKRYTA